MDGNVNSINWFEIPAADINRAKKFYETVFNINMESQNMMGMEMAFFPWDPGNGKVAGALVQSDMHIPSGHGVKIYLNGNPDLAVPLANVEKAGGTVTMPKTLIDEQTGYMAFIVDSEGNTVGFHSQH
jgi:predicted enzyme related to lactoylglutathione lyase